MGAEPLKDMLMSMRFRSNWMKNSCPDRAKKANELENTNLVLPIQVKMVLLSLVIS
jgi:hypothetical protein